MNYLDYFLKNKEGFKRFIDALKIKYEKTGSFNGYIKLDNITEIEKEAFEKFFGTNFEVNSNVKISLKKFNKVIEKSKFKDFNIETLNNKYYQRLKLF